MPEENKKEKEKADEEKVAEDAPGSDEELDVNAELKKIRELVGKAEGTIKYLNRKISDLETATRVDYRQIDGVFGTYDGVNLVTEDGSKYNVPENYAAKSMLVFGDALKIMETDGKQLFKQVTKVDRERVEGVTSKKGGKWYVLTEHGSHKILDVAADFQKVEQNGKALVLLPKDNLAAPFAALDRVLRQKQGEEKEVVESITVESKSEKKKKPAPKKTEKKAPTKKPTKKSAAKAEKKVTTTKKATKKKAAPKKTTAKKATTATKKPTKALDDDDLR